MVIKLRLLAGILLAATAGHAAEVFTTTGENGERVYTDRPRSGSQKIELKITGARASEPAPTVAKPEFKDLAPCEQARFILEKYENAKSLAEKTADGGTRTLSPEESAAKIQQARSDVQRLCEEDDDE